MVSAQEGLEVIGANQTLVLSTNAEVTLKNCGRGVWELEVEDRGPDGLGRRRHSWFEFITVRGGVRGQVDETLEGGVVATAKRARTKTEVQDAYGIAVAFYGWGTWEDDVYLTTHAPGEGQELTEERIQAAIEEFYAAIQDGTFTGHGSDNYRDRVRYGDMEETVLVYAMTEVGEYRARRAWERV